VEALSIYGVARRAGDFECADGYCVAAVGAYTQLWRVARGESVDMGLSRRVVVWCHDAACADAPTAERFVVNALGDGGTLYSDGDEVSAADDRLVFADPYRSAYDESMMNEELECENERQLVMLRTTSDLRRARDLVGCVLSRTPTERTVVEVRGRGDPRRLGATVESVGQMANVILGSYFGAELCPEVEAGAGLLAGEAEACARRWVAAIVLRPELSECDDCTVGWHPVGMEQ
jgi:hypothetical protein